MLSHVLKADWSLPCKFLLVLPVASSESSDVLDASAGRQRFILYFYLSHNVHRVNILDSNSCVVLSGQEILV